MQEVIPAGSLTLAGTPVRCGVARTVVAPIGDIAMTYPGAIVLNPRLFSMPPAIQHFWYAHECAHQLFGYDEQNADCWAIQTGKRMGWFRMEDFQWMNRELQYLPGDADHLPGPERLAGLKSCYAAGAAPEVQPVPEARPATATRIARQAPALHSRPSS
ncbi:MAG TPA: hypothetical protein VF503_04960 [Sphingobium sp.]|uniref:hypothetical protein n=1 Tax=Sphingobium sp. TaxID=1912891 RepID=UPI002ED34D5A